MLPPRIAFTRWRDDVIAGPHGKSGSEAWLVGTDGSARRFGDDGTAHPVAWSPDGRLLALFHLKHGFDGTSFDVVVADAEGTVVRTFPGTGPWLAWAPDSRRLVASVDTRQENVPLAVYEVMTGEQTARIDSVLVKTWGCCVSWEPADRLAVAGRFAPDTRVGPGTPQLLTLEPSGEDVRVIEPREVSVSRYIWAPRSRLVFAVAGSLWLAEDRVAGSRVKLAAGVYESPHVSPDGNSIAVLRHEGEPSRLLMIEARESGTSRVVMQDGPTNLGAQPSVDAFGFGGDSSILARRQGDIWIVEPDGEQRRLTSTPDRDDSPVAYRGTEAA